MEEQPRYYDDEIRLKDVILKVRQLKTDLLKNWKLIFVFGALFAGIGLLYSAKEELRYEAELTFVVEDGKSGGGSLSKYAGLASQFGFDMGMGSSTTFSENNIIELLTSRRIVENALLNEVEIDGKKQLLANYHIDFNNYRERWSENTDLAKLVYPNDRDQFTLLHDSVLGVSWKNLTKMVVSVEMSDETNIIRVKCNSKNEKFAKLLSESLVDEMSAYYIQSQTAKARHTLDFIENRGDSALRELKSAELAYALHKDSNFGVMRAQGLLEELRLKREVEILNVMYAEIIKNLEISKVTLLNQKPLVNIIDTPTYPLEQKGFSGLKGLVLFGVLGVMLGGMYVISRSLVQDALKD